MNLRFKIMNKLSLIIVFLFIPIISIAQVGIGTVTVEGDALLQIDSENKGILTPQVNLNDLDTFLPLTGTATNGLLVFNTNTTTGTGYYYWDGSKWKGIDTDLDWKMFGNSLTTPGTNYFGSSDTENFILGTTGTERVTFTSDGQISINNNAPSSTDKFSVTTPSGVSILGYGTGTGIGVYGEHSGTGDAVYGIVNGGTGVYGRAYTSTTYGSYGKNTDADGNGVVGAGNNITANSLADGAGGSFTGEPYGTVSWSINDHSGDNVGPSYGIVAAGNGLNLETELAANFAAYTGGMFKGNQWGITSIADISGAANNSISRAAFFGQYTKRNSNRETIYIGASYYRWWTGTSTHYKLFGTGGGSVSTTMRTKNDGERILFAPESPENWFFDIGEVKLINGKAKVEIDPIFVEVISKETPFKVFVQGGENTLGHISLQRNQSGKYFTLEDKGGPSNGTVVYKVLGIWKGKENLRFPEYKEDSHLAKEIKSVKLEVKQPEDISHIQTKE